MIKAELAPFCSSPEASPWHWLFPISQRNGKASGIQEKTGGITFLIITGTIYRNVQVESQIWKVHAEES